MPAKSSREPKTAKETPPSGDNAAYPDSRAHLMDNLRRVEQMVRAQVVRWRATIAANKPENLWGMVHVTESEVQGFLKSEPGAPEEYGEETKAAVDAHWQAASEMARQIEARQRSTPTSTVLRLLRLVDKFRVPEPAYNILLVCLLPEFDVRFRRIYGFLQDDASKTQPTVELVAAIISRQGNGLAEIREHLDASASLLSQGLLEMADRSQEPLPVRSLRIEDRIAGFLLGSDAPDARIREFVSTADPLDLTDVKAEEPHIKRLRTLAEWRRNHGTTGAAIFLHGIYGSGRFGSARALATELHIPLLRVDTIQGGRAPIPWEELVRLAFREARLREAALYWPDCDEMLRPGPLAARWDDLVKATECFDGLVLFGSEAAWSPAGHFHVTPFLRVDLPLPSYELRYKLWMVYLPPASSFAEPVANPEEVAQALANRFPLTEGQIQDAVSAARAQAVVRDPKAPLLTRDDFYEGCRRQSGRRLLSFTKRIEPRPDIAFADLILPDTNLRQLRELQHRIRTMHRVYSELGFEQRLRLGRGMVVLFTGSSGTGKTMAAEWLARDLGVDLHKADLSLVVSKWVGETEKNLHQLLGEAEGSSAIIFFDEADALFGKRGEVKDARDRWANTEVNFLLQRIEEYSGVVILASNLRQNIDEAFLRRISAMVEFPAPDEAARMLIWRGMFPPGLERPSDDELRSLAARVRIAGGSVRNIVLDAVFRAVSGGIEKPAVTLRHLVLATGREYQKLGRPITKAELGDVFYRWIEQEIL